MSFDGRVALVTGSTRGIGRVVAELLQARGATVVTNGRTGGTLPFDVSDPEAVTAAVRELFSTHKRLDVVVNNAGAMGSAVLGMITADAARHAFDVNALGTLHVTQATARLLARSPGGAIVNVCSIVGQAGASGQTAYAGAKAAVAGITRAAAKELAPAIRVNAVAPGMIDTELLADLPEAVRAERVAAIGLARIGAAQEVAEAIAWLASDAASYVTGQILGVDGGMVI